jgi:hypothetical protein
METATELRKAGGAFSTPPEAARYVCEWAIGALRLVAD